MTADRSRNSIPAAYQVDIASIGCFHSSVLATGARLCGENVLCLVAEYLQQYEEMGLETTGYWCGKGWRHSTEHEQLTGC